AAGRLEQQQCMVPRGCPATRGVSGSQCHRGVLATLALKRPPVHLCIRAGPTSVRAVIRGAGCNHDSFTKGPHLITPKSGHLDTQEDRLLYSSRSELRVASRTTLRSPRLSFHTNRISIFSTHTEEISAHL
ncbi:hypothetical protein KUCAC02_021433, partial [Chaenocephalus aceratus]